MFGKSVVIVGTHRSGTSSVAGALARLGVYFGREDDLHAADEHNPGGYWEHRHICAVHRRFMLSLDLRSADVDPMPERWLERPPSEYMVDCAAKALDKFFQNKGAWAFKDPPASMLLPFLSTYFKRAGAPLPHVIICVRNPDDVARSQEKRRGTPVEQTVGSWLMSTLCALRDARELDMSLVHFEDFLKNPLEQLAPALEHLEMDPNPDQRHLLDSWVKPDWATQREPSLSMPPLINQLYELTKRLRNDSDQTGQKELETIWVQSTMWRQLLVREPLVEATAIASWTHKGHIHTERVTYRPDAHWQMLRLKVSAPPGTDISVHLYPLPAVIWLRSIGWSGPEGKFPCELQVALNGSVAETFGVLNLWPRHGSEQLKTKVPPTSGPHELVLEMLIDNGVAAMGSVFQNLSALAANSSSGLH